MNIAIKDETKLIQGQHLTVVNQECAQTVAVIDRLTSDDKHLLSAKLHRQLQGCSLEQTLEILKIELHSTNHSISNIVDAEYIAEDIKVELMTNIAGNMYLYDTLAYRMKSEIYTNISLAHLLLEINAAIIEIDTHPALLIGSIKGIDYIENNKSNPLCPLKQYFTHIQRDLIWLGGRGDHVRQILKSKPVNPGQAVIDISAQPSLFGFFEKHVEESNYRHKVTIISEPGANERKIKISPQTPGAEPSWKSDFGWAFMLQAMADTYKEALAKGYDYVTLLMNGKECMAYKAISITLPNKRVNIELQLIPKLTDSESETSKLSNDNVSELINAIKSKIQNGEPCIVNTAASCCPDYLHYTLLRHLLVNEPHSDIIVNAEQVYYTGSNFIPVKLVGQSIEDISQLTSPVVIYGKANTETSAADIEKLLNNLTPVIAIITGSTNQLPEKLQQFVYQSRAN